MPASRSWRARHATSARVLAVYAALGLLANLPTWPGDPGRLGACTCGGNKDPVQTAWFLAWTPYALLHGHSLFSSGVINAPFGVNLAQNTGITLLGLLTAPLTLLVSPIASENLLRFLVFPASAFAMYAVLLRWVRYAPAAFVGGLIYGFSPYMTGQASVHLDLSFVPFPPLIFYVLHELAVAQRRNPVVTGLVLGALLAAQFYVSAEILATTLLAAALAAVLLLVARPRRVPAHALHVLEGLVIAAGVAGALCFSPTYLMLHGPQRYVGPSVGLHEIYNADLLGPVLPTSSELVAPKRLVAIGSSLVGGLSNVDENGSYLGIPLLVAAIWLTIAFRRNRWMRLCAALAVAMFILSLGPHLVVDGRPRHLPFALPFAGLHRLPLLEDLLPARLALYVALFLSILVALGLATWHDEVVARRIPGAAAGAHWTATRAPRVAAGLLAVTAVVALLPRWPYRSIAATPLPAERPAALAAIPAGSRVLTYPYVTPSNDIAMLWQALAGMRFSLLGSYMLRREPTGGATQLPSALAPYDVEGMLADALAPSPVPIPLVPYLAPTTATVEATTIVVGHYHGPRPAGRPVLAGVVQNADPHTRSFYVVGRNGDLIGVLARRRTRYLPHTRSPRPFRAVRRGEHLVLYGRLVDHGTVGPRRIAELREFLARNGVDAVLVELGRHDSAEVVRWCREAIGAPTRLVSGGALWLHVQRDLHG